MTVGAPLIQYRKEYIAQFEQHQSMLRAACVTEHVSNGFQVTFLVSGSQGQTAVTRGVNGLIPYNDLGNNQITATLVEKHAPFEKTGFNIFASQGPQQQIMQMGSIAVINRDIDDVMLAELATATVTTGAAATASTAMVAKAKAVLGLADVDLTSENDIFGLISPAFEAYLMQDTKFASADYVDVKPLSGPSRRMRNWFGINWILSNRLPGRATNSETNFLFHRNAIGHAVNVGEERVMAGYDDKQDISWTRATIYHAAKLLQNSGVVKMVHDGSAYVGS